MAKREHAETATESRTAKRTKLFDDNDSSASDEESAGTNGAQTLNINKEYASRFEHNKKREEKQRLEEKYGAPSEHDSDDESSSEDDEEAELINDNVDQEILATINAIRSKDPKIYNEKVTFYSESGPENTQTNGSKKEKPMNLRDYHRKTLLEGHHDEDEQDEPPPMSYMQEQQALKDSIVKQMHATAENEEDSDGSEGSDGFLVRKSKPVPTAAAEGRSKRVELDITTADKDPDTFLSNFMQSNAWRAASPSRFQPFESDDDEELDKADEFEEAYNRRFEDPKKSNATMQSHSRDIIAKYSVRREDLSGRQKARQAEKAKKEAEKLERAEEKAQLKRMKVEEMERKVKQIREAAGASGKSFQLDDWASVLDGDFDDNQWEAEMKKRFGEDYYAEVDFDVSDDGQAGSSKKKRKPKKPTWDDDIDIKDIVPDFSGEEDAAVEDAEDDDEGGSKSSKRNMKKERAKAKEEAKRAARRDRRLIENLVEQNFDLGAPSSSKGKQASQFRYRETSPKSFGLTPRDILFASDADLNNFAGLKKLHAFRDAEKKQKDKKYLSKKARLRQWRRDTFGDEDGPKINLDEDTNERPEAGDGSNTVEGKRTTFDSEGEPVGEGKKKRKRSKKSKTAAESDA